MIVDRLFDRKPKAQKYKPASHPSSIVDQPLPGQDIRQFEKVLRLPKPPESRAKAAAKAAPDETDVTEEVQQRIYNGPFAQAELDRLKLDLQEAKKVRFSFTGPSRA